MASTNTNTSLGTAMHIMSMKANCMSNDMRTWQMSNNMQPNVMMVGSSTSRVRHMPACKRVKFHHK